MSDRVNDATRDALRRARAAYDPAISADLWMHLPADDRLDPPEGMSWARYERRLDWFYEDAAETFRDLARRRFDGNLVWDGESVYCVIIDIGYGDTTYDLVVNHHFQGGVSFHLYRHDTAESVTIDLPGIAWEDEGDSIVELPEEDGADSIIRYLDALEAFMDAAESESESEGEDAAEVEPEAEPTEAEPTEDEPEAEPTEAEPEADPTAESESEDEVAADRVLMRVADWRGVLYLAWCDRVL